MHVNRARLITIIWVVIVAVATIQLIAPEHRSAGQPSNVTVVMPYWPPYLVHTWAAFDGAVRTNGFVIQNASQDEVPASFDAAASGYADIALVPLTAVPAIKQQNQDIRILPYKLELPSDWVGIYTTEESDIRTIEDLKGRDIILPTNICRIIDIIHLKTFTELERRGINISTINWTREPAAPGPTFNGSTDTAQMLDTYDAALVTEYPSGDIRPVAFPLKNTSMVSMVFVAQPSAVQYGDEWMNTLNRSAQYGQARVPAILRVLQNMAPGNVTVGQNGLIAHLARRNTLVTTFDEADKRHIQAVFNRMYRNNRTTERLSLTHLLAHPQTAWR